MRRPTHSITAVYTQLMQVREWNALNRFDDLRRREFSLEYPVPEAAGDAKAVLVVREMVLQVVFLEVTVVRRQAERALADDCKNVQLGRT